VPHRILFLNRWPQYREKRRWDNELARFADLSAGHDVTYLVDAGGRSGAPDDAAVHVVEDFADVPAVLRQVDRIVAAAGPFDRVIAFSEFLLDLAATLRARYGVPGATPEETDRFRDKRIMKEVLARAGVRVPRWAAARTPEQVLALAAPLGYPLILKPVRGASSQGVHEVAGPEQLDRLCRRVDLAGYEIEEFVRGDILHADGVVDHDGRILFLSLARYVSTCLDFERGEPLGSVLLTDPDSRARFEPFATEVVAALGLTGSAFHLEFFDTPTGPVFLEIGARVPGADVPYVIRDVHGVNLFQLWVDVALGVPVRPPVPAATTGGWLTVPAPRPLPRRVLDATPMLGRVPYLYRELVPRPGEILRAQAGSYATLQAARFLFHGPDAAAVTAALDLARRTYRLESEPLEASFAVQE
jgi:hypothetical protein